MVSVTDGIEEFNGGEGCDYRDECGAEEGVDQDCGQCDGGQSDADPDGLTEVSACTLG
jgi:hypothetical protein